MYYFLPGWFYNVCNLSSNYILLLLTRWYSYTVVSMLFPPLQLHCTSEEPRNGVYEKPGKISFPEGTPSTGSVHVHFE